VRPHSADLLQRFLDWTPLDADRSRILSLNAVRLYRL
jgi:predicted TIM-barrel fold metal-dependent hydrolase